MSKATKNRKPAREVIFVQAGPLDKDDVARALARLVTKGDATAYVKKVMDKASQPKGAG